MKKMILANLKEFFEQGTFKPFNTLAELEHFVLESNNLIPEITIDNCIFTLKGMKNNEDEQVIIYNFNK
jgi:hypothetical protein